MSFSIRESFDKNPSELFHVADIHGPGITEEVANHHLRRCLAANKDRFGHVKHFVALFSGKKMVKLFKLNKEGSYSETSPISKSAIHAVSRLVANPKEEYSIVGAYSEDPQDLYHAAPLFGPGLDSATADLYLAKTLESTKPSDRRFVRPFVALFSGKRMVKLFKLHKSSVTGKESYKSVEPVAKSAIRSVARLFGNGSKKITASEISREANAISYSQGDRLDRLVELALSSQSKKLAFAKLCKSQLDTAPRNYKLFIPLAKETLSRSGSLGIYTHETELAEAFRNLCTMIEKRIAGQGLNKNPGLPKKEADKIARRIEAGAKPNALRQNPPKQSRLKPVDKIPPGKVSDMFANASKPSQELLIGYAEGKIAYNNPSNTVLFNDMVKKGFYKADTAASRAKSKESFDKLMKKVRG